MLKIKILSMQRVPNHGSFLQSYALKKILESLGGNVSFYDIKIGESNAAISDNRKNELKYNNRKDHILKRIKMRFAGKKQNRIFEEQLEKFLDIGENVDIEEACDLAVIGSDEVFNCVVPSKWGFTTQLFGNIPQAKRIITYAASCGRTTVDRLNDYFYGKIKESFRNVSAFSVRDMNTYHFVEKIAERSPQMHLDPVLIYDFSEEVETCQFKAPFLLLYSYTNRICNPNEVAEIKKFAKKKGLKIVCAGVFQYWCDYNIPVSSFELLGYFQKATYVVTDTFHGTIMAVKFKKQFISLVRESNKQKLVYLLQCLNLSNQQVDNIFNMEHIIENNIDYKAVSKILEQERQKTFNYLEQQIKNI